MRLLNVILFSLIFLFVFAPDAIAKSFYFPEVNIDIVVSSDSSVNVTEKRTFSFDGSFSQIYWDIPVKENQKIENIEIFEKTNIQELPYMIIPYEDVNRPDQKYWYRRNGNSYHIEAYHRSQDTKKEFILSYKLTNAVVRYTDIAQLYWKVIGDKWGSRTDKVTITVTLPKDVGKSNIYVWAHGPLNGTSEIINGRTTKFTVFDIPPQTFIEIRELFPVSIINSGPSVNMPYLDEVKNEEKLFQEKTVFSARLKLLGFFTLVVVFIAWVIFWYAIWYKFGRERRSDVPKYVHNPPSNMQPALVEALVNQGASVTPNAFAATILDLARRKYLKIEAVEKISKGFLGIGAGKNYKYILHIDEKNYISKKPLLPFEQMVYDYLFLNGERKEISVDDLKSDMKLNPAKTRKFFQDFRNEIKKEFNKRGFLEKTGSYWKNMFIVLNVLFFIIYLSLLAVLFHVFIETFYFIIFFSIFFGVFVLHFLGRVYLNWSKPVEKEAFEWVSFKRFLNDFSRFKNEIPQAVVIWEEMLVYGTALGVARKVSKYLPLILAQQKNVAPGWYYMTTSNSSISNSFIGVNLDFSSSLAQGVSLMSTSFGSSFSSGSGGGFSGGGGGGGGAS